LPVPTATGPEVPCPPTDRPALHGLLQRPGRPVVVMPPASARTVLDLPVTDPFQPGSRCRATPDPFVPRCRRAPHFGRRAARTPIPLASAAHVATVRVRSIAPYPRRTGGTPGASATGSGPGRPDRSRTLDGTGDPGDGSRAE